MLRTLTDLEDYSIDATDGTIGQVKDFYFDDAAWVIRYFVVETGTWHSKRKVLISPLVLGKPNWEARPTSTPITTTRAIGTAQRRRTTSPQYCTCMTIIICVVARRS